MTFERVAVLSDDGPVWVESNELTFVEHEIIISHWEEVWRYLYSRNGDAEKFDRRMRFVERARQALYEGKVPYKDETP